MDMSVSDEVETPSPSFLAAESSLKDRLLRTAVFKILIAFLFLASAEHGTEIRTVVITCLIEGSDVIPELYSNAHESKSLRAKRCAIQPI